MAGAAFVTDLTELATQIAEAAAGIAGIMNGFDILKISRNYYKLYATQRENYYAVFQQGVEIPLIAQINGMPVYVMDYQARLDTLYSSTGPLGAAVGDAGAWWDRHAAMYSTVRDSRITELEPDMARLKADWGNYLFRYEEHWFDVRNDTRWNRRFIAHNIGIKQGSAVSAMLASSFGRFQDEMLDTGAQLATFANGAAKFAGYRRGLNDIEEAFSSSLPRQQTLSFMQNNKSSPTKRIPYQADTFGYRDMDRSPVEAIP